jgi:hypothetical protein
MHQPSVLNAIASSSGTARLLRREVDALRTDTAHRLDDVVAQTETMASAIHDRLASIDARSASVDARLDEVSEAADRLAGVVGVVEPELERIAGAARQGDEDVRDELRTHVATISWLLKRVELVRAELMNEIRYGHDRHEQIVAHVVNPAALEPSDGELRVNLGAGHLPVEGYVNVDMRELPGIDVVATVDGLPFEPGSLTEVFSAHTLEHFPLEELRRKLLPYWFELLRPAGTFRAVVPDLEAMIAAYEKGATSFETLRSVAYGGQEYEGDFHFTGFSPTSLVELLTEAGFENAEVIAHARPNGDCLECEVSARRPVT